MRSIQEWEELVEEYYKSGLATKDWCDKKGINLSTFRERMSRMRKGKNLVVKNSKEVPFVKLSTEGEAIPKKIEESIEINVGNIHIRVNSEFNEASFSKVCKLLKALC